MKPSLTINLLAAAIAAACAGLPQQAAAAEFPVLFSRDAMPGTSIPSGDVREQMQGITQVRLPEAGTASFAGRARYKLRDDSSVELQQGSVTVATGTSGRTIVVHMPNGVVGEVSGQNAVASFSVEGNESRGHVLGGTARIAGTAFATSQFWKAGANGRVERVIAMGAQAAPASADGGLASLRGGGVVAASEAGFPVGFADTLAAAGASTDLVLAARRVQLAVANPSIASFPSGDFQLLVAHAARLSAPYGGAAFPGASADIIRSYLHYLAGGGSGAEFLSVYAGLMAQYVDLIRTGANPASFEGVAHADILAFLAYQQRINGFAAIGADNRMLLDAYLAFLAGGGQAANFVAGYTNLVSAYFTFLRAGGVPTEFAGATQDTLKAYIDFLSRSNLLVRLSAGDQALLQAYLTSLRAGGTGFDFAVQYRDALAAFRAYLEAGNLPSEYTALDLATLRAYMTTLQASGLLDVYLGEYAGFYRDLLVYLQDGGSIDLFPGLPNPSFPLYADALRAYYAYLAEGGLPAAYTGLDAATLNNYLRALIEAGRLDALLGDQAAFLRAYYAFIAAGHSPDLFPGLPVFGQYATYLSSYFTYLAEGGLPAAYTGLDADTLARYLRALIDSGQLEVLLGEQAAFLRSYYAYIAAGHSPDLFPGLPAYTHYETALRAYYAYLMGGGLPSSYTALTLEQLQAYIAALERAGLFSVRFSGDILVFLRDYYAWIVSGGLPDGYAGLPNVPDPPGPGTTRSLQMVTAMNRPGTALGTALDGRGSVNTAEVDANGVPMNTITPYLQAITIPASAQVYERSNVEGVYVGRLTGGDFVRADQTFTLGANQGLHYAYVAPATGIPTTGTFNYVLTGATKPTWNGGELAPGTFDAQAVLSFAPGDIRLAMVGTVAMPGDATYSFTTPGGLGAVATQGSPLTPSYRLNAAMTGTGRACSAGSTCSLTGAFIIGNAAASGLALSYTSSSTNTGDSVFAGAAGFYKGGAYTPPTTPSDSPWANLTVPYTDMVVLSNGSGALSSGLKSSMTVKFDADGILQATPNLLRGTAAVSDAGHAGNVLAWSRWQNPGIQNAANGEPVGSAGNYYATMVLGERYVAPATTGRVDYALVGGIAPREGGTGATGTLTGSASVWFSSSPRVGFDLTATMPTATYRITTPGFASDPNQWMSVLGQGQFSGAGNWATGATCAPTCYSRFEGWVAGNGGSHIALSYGVYFGSGDSRDVFGMAAFAKGSSTTPPPTTPTGTGFTGTRDRMLGMQLTSGTPYFTAATSPQGYSVAFNSDPWGILSVTSRGNNVREAQGDSQVISSGWVAGDKAAWVTWAGGTQRPGRFTNWLLLPEMSGTLPTSTTVNYGTVVGGMAPTMIKNGEYVTGTAWGRAALQFGGGSYKLGMEMQVKMGANVYDLATTGGVAAPSVNMILRGSTSGELASLTATDYMYTANNMGGLCTTTRCVANIMVQASGNQGSVLGANYNVWNHVDSTNNFGGSAVFVKDATPAVNGAAVVAGAAGITPMSIGSLGSMGMAVAPPPVVVPPSAGWQRWEAPAATVATIPEIVPVAGTQAVQPVDAANARERLERIFNGGIRFQAQR